MQFEIVKLMDFDYPWMTTIEHKCINDGLRLRSIQSKLCMDHNSFKTWEIYVRIPHLAWSQVTVYGSKERVCVCVWLGLDSLFDGVVDYHITEIQSLCGL